MFRTLALALFLLVAAGAALAAGADPLMQWSSIPATAFIANHAEQLLPVPHSFAMFFSGLCVMGLIARRRYH